MSIDSQFTPDCIEPTATVEISISCRNLLDMDLFSRSDPMCVIYHQLGTSSDTQWVELVRTEVIWNCLNPDFVTKVVIDYRFFGEQNLRFEVYDIDTPSAMNLDYHDFIGCAECTLGQIIAAGYKGLRLELQQKKNKFNTGKLTKGSIILIAEEMHQFKEEVTIRLRGYSMGTTRFCMFAPQIFYVLAKVNESGTMTIVYRSEASSGESPTWVPATIPMRSLCNADKDRGLQFQFFQVGLKGYHKSLGYYNTTVNKMKNFKPDERVKLVGKNGKEKGASVEIFPLVISPIHSFMEYISGGCNIHCCFAIDFTASNGDPEDPNTLHHISEIVNRTNPYEQAIQAVGEIVQDYDHTKLFPVYGFGARIPPDGDVSHNFPVTLTDSPYCKGISGVLEAYRNCLKSIILYGPTNFAPIVKNVANLAKQNLGGGHYYILLIITDGIITDMPDTKEAIVDAAVLPLSILIIGVGNANFSAMDELDGDIVRLSSNGREAERDIVNFIPYRDSYTWMNSICPEIVGKWSSSKDSTEKLAKVKLAKEVLAEIPDQLLSFMKSRNIAPVKPKHSLAQQKARRLGLDNDVENEENEGNPNGDDSDVPTSPTFLVGDSSGCDIAKSSSSNSNSKVQPLTNCSLGPTSISTVSTTPRSRPTSSVFKEGELKFDPSVDRIS